MENETATALIYMTQQDTKVLMDALHGLVFTDPEFAGMGVVEACSKWIRETILPTYEALLREYSPFSYTCLRDVK